MATIKCEKVRITISQGNEFELLDRLHVFGKVELIRKKQVHLHHASLEENKKKIETAIATLDRGITTLQPLLPKQSFLEGLSDNRIPLSEKDVKEYLEEKDDIFKQAEIIETKLLRIEELKKQEHKMHALIESLEPFKEIDLEIFEDFTNFFLKAFTVATSDKETLIKDVQSNFEDIEFYPVAEIEKFSTMVVAGPKELKEDTVEFMKNRVKFLELDKDFSGNFKTITTQSKEKIETLKKEREHLEKDIDKQIKNISKFYALKDILYWEVQKTETLDAFVLHSGVYMVDFWISPEDLKELEALVKKIDEKGSVSVYSNLNHKERKVMLRNLNFFKSFEAVTTTMGYPEADEVDPTPILTPFFILFFGLALSDAGYGLLLTLFTGFLLFTRKLKPGIKSMMSILFWCGISTAVFGVLMGSWFGWVPDDYKATLEGNPLSPVVTLLQSSQIINPVTAIPLMLGIMVALGIIHLITGYIAAFIAKVKHGKFLAGLLDDLLPALLIISLVFFAATKGVESLAYLSSIATYVLLAMFAFTILAKGRSAGIILMIPVGMLQTFMSTVGLLSETLSYARLLALGISTGVIAGVINTLALLTGGTPVIGPILVAIIMLLGHTLNIMLNLLGSYINSSRLQFVEFFPKFMSSAGKPLVPFKRSEEHIILNHK